LKKGVIAVKTRLSKVIAPLAVAILLLTAVAGAQVQANQTIEIDSAAEEVPALRSTLGEVDVSLAPQTGKARFLRLTPGQSEAVARQLGAQGSAEERAIAFLEAYGALFGIRDAGAELRLAQMQTDQAGNTHVSYEQVYQGLPVFAGVLRVHMDAAGMITAVNGLFIPELAVNTAPHLSAEQAALTAQGVVNSDVIDADRADAVGTTLLVFRENLALGLPGANHLAYEVEVSNGRDVREFVYVDAHSGKVIDQITGIFDALYRNVYNKDYSGSPIWEEGDELPFDSPSLDPEVIADVNNVLDYTEDTYNMVAAASSGTYLSYDALDAPMDLVVDSTLIGCPNAMWNGTFAQFCRQITGDDTVAHEWGHAYTEYTHNLIYAWQPGALSESYSDIFGEVVDLINGDGLDEPGDLRTDGACSAYTAWPPMLTVTAPESIAGDYAAAPAQFGPAVDGTLSGTLMAVIGDGSTVEDTSLGCDPLVNDLTAMIAFIRRGECDFAVKVKNAQDAGAIGAVVANHEEGGDSTLTMAGEDDTITIQSLFIGFSDGNAIEAEIPNGVDVEFNLATVGTEPDDSYRWLSGEDDLGGAIRDMWTPSCYGDPDNATSGDYMCGATDNGGVHYNCGVPNHAFALTVDGGNFNGYSITGIGLTKAFHIYWQAQQFYQTPTTDFADHADALEDSCEDLLGEDLPDLTDGLPSGEMITEADCAELEKAILAVELRTYPDQCGYEPLLAKDPPEVCATQTEPFFQEAFDTDPGTWTLTNEGVYAEYVPRDWMWLDSLPDAAQGGFYAEDSLVVGDCVPHSDDQSGVAYLDSPTMTVPAGDGFGRTMVVFDHYLATEPEYDGGNVWIKVNGGDWQLLEASDFDYNAYNGTLASADDGNTNPLAGQAAFHGSDEGAVSGSWGQSQIDLSAYAGTGDEIQLRFALGTDGCNGLDGWYLDQVSAYYCSEAEDYYIYLPLVLKGYAAP
jgi:Zn-dependent metalloprotease